jgi:cytidine deaminase
MERGDPVLLDVHTEGDDPPFPCGLCRQTAVGADDDTVAYSTLGRHLPDLFRL